MFINRKSHDFREMVSDVAGRVMSQAEQLESAGKERLEVIGVGGGKFRATADGGGGNHGVETRATLGTGEMVDFPGEGRRFRIKGDDAGGEDGGESGLGDHLGSHRMVCVVPSDERDQQVRIEMNHEP